MDTFRSLHILLDVYRTVTKVLTLLEQTYPALDIQSILFPLFVQMPRLRSFDSVTTLQ